MAFPTQPIVDPCMRADENPISLGGLWTGPVGFDCKLASNRLQGNSAIVSIAGWVNQATAGDCEMYVTMATLPTTAGERVQLFVRASVQASFSSGNAYRLDYDVDTDSLTLFRMDAGATTTLVHESSGISNNGDGFGLSAIGTSFQMYRYLVLDLAWEALGDSITDATYSGPGYFTISSTGGTSSRCTNIGAGPVSSVPPGGGSGVFSGAAVPSSHSLDRGMYKAFARGIAR